MSRRTGRLSIADWNFIEANAETMSIDQMADHLNRTPESVRHYLSKTGRHPDKVEGIAIQAEYDLKSRKYWRELKAQFSEEELDLFVYHWAEIVAQFRKDVLPTEELQVIDLIKLELLMNRALREQQTSSLSINELEAQVQELKSQPASDQDREVIFNIERQIASLRAAKESLSREFKDLQSKKSNLYKDLKATREQRIEKLENNKQTLGSLVNRILRDPEFFIEEGKALEKMRLAAEKERERLSDYYTYADGTVDQPFLTPDTVK